MSPQRFTAVQVSLNWDVLLQLNRNSGAEEFGVVQYYSPGGTKAICKQRRHLIDSSKKKTLLIECFVI